MIIRYSYSKALFLGAALVLALALIGAGSPRMLDASTCGGFGSTLCKVNEECVNILFYKMCTTTYDYYSDIDPNWPNDPGGNDPFAPEPPVIGPDWEIDPDDYFPDTEPDPNFWRYVVIRPFVDPLRWFPN